MTVTNTGIPVISGQAVQGKLLSTTNGTWTFDDDYLSYAYQWERCDAGGASCVDIVGATSSTYSLGGADVGSTIRVKVTATEHTNPSGSVILSEDWTNISNPPWDAMYTYTGTPSIGGGVTQSPCGRLQCVTAPDGIGRALRTEMRDSDPGWPNNPSTDRAHLSAPNSQSYGGPIAYGDIFYFDFELWLPLNNPVGDYFDYPRNQWYRLWEPHSASASQWTCFTLISDGLPANNAWMPLRLAGGNFPSTPAYYPLFQLTNSDGSWHTQNFNRRLHIRYGGRFAPDNTGWFEAFVDGTQVIPQTFRPTMWTGDFGNYLVVGQYKAHGDLFPHHGKSVVYYMKTTTESA